MDKTLNISPIPRELLEHFLNCTPHQKSHSDWIKVDDYPFETETTIQLESVTNGIPPAKKWIWNIGQIRDKSQCAGLQHAELIAVQSNMIPSDWNYFNLIFAGTVFQNRNGEGYVPYLERIMLAIDFEWLIKWKSMEDYCHDNDYLVRVIEPSYDNLTCSMFDRAFDQNKQLALV